MANQASGNSSSTHKSQAQARERPNTTLGYHCGSTSSSTTHQYLTGTSVSKNYASSIVQSNSNNSGTMQTPVPARSSSKQPTSSSYQKSQQRSNRGHSVGASHGNSHSKSGATRYSGNQKLIQNTSSKQVLNPS